MCRQGVVDVGLIKKRKEEIREIFLALEDIEKVVKCLRKIDDEELKRAIVCYLLMVLGVAGSVVFSKKCRNSADELFIGYLLGLGDTVDVRTLDRVLEMVEGCEKEVDVFIEMIRYALYVLSENKDEVEKLLEGEEKEKVIN